MIETRKIIQITAGNITEQNNGQQHMLYALCDDGTIWEKLPFSGEWQKVATTAITHATKFSGYYQPNTHAFSTLMNKAA